MSWSIFCRHHHHQYHRRRWSLSLSIISFISLSLFCYIAWFLSSCLCIFCFSRRKQTIEDDSDTNFFALFAAICNALYARLYMIEMLIRLHSFCYSMYCCIWWMDLSFENGRFFLLLFISVSSELPTISKKPIDKKRKKGKKEKEIVRKRDCGVSDNVIQRKDTQRKATHRKKYTTEIMSSRAYNSIKGKKKQQITKIKITSFFNHFMFMSRIFVSFYISVILYAPESQCVDFICAAAKNRTLSVYNTSRNDDYISRIRLIIICKCIAIPHAIRIRIRVAWFLCLTPCLPTIRSNIQRRSNLIQNTQQTLTNIANQSQ